MGARAKGACHASEQRKRGRQRQAIYRPPAAHLCRQRICVSIPAFKHMRCASDANFTRAGPGQAGRAGAARQHLLRIEVGRQVAREDADHDKALLQAVRSAPAVSPDTQQAARAKDKRRRWHSATSSRWTALMFPYKCATTVLHPSQPRNCNPNPALHLQRPHCAPRARRAAPNEQAAHARRRRLRQVRWRRMHRKPNSQAVHGAAPCAACDPPSHASAGSGRAACMHGQHWRRACAVLTHAASLPPAPRAARPAGARAPLVAEATTKLPPSDALQGGTAQP